MSTATPASTSRLTDAAIRKRLASAATHCAGRGAQLTLQRAEVLELLLRRGGQAKAYDLQEDMQARHGRIAPTTVYRALEFLQDHKLVHKVDATNSFMACTHADHEHASLLLICTQCGRVDELHEHKALAPLLKLVHQQGSTLQAVEVKSLCAGCQSRA